MSAIEKEYKRIEDYWKYIKIGNGFSGLFALYKLKKRKVHGVEILFNGIHPKEEYIHKCFYFNNKCYGEEIIYTEKIKQ